MGKKDNNLKKAMAVLLCLISSFACTGCWDKVEIESRAIILTLGIDKNMKGKKSLNKYIVSYGFPNPSPSQGSSQGGGGSSTPKFDIATVGPSFFDGTRELSTRIDKQLYYADAKTIVFGKDLLKDPKLFRYFIDVVLRQDQFSKTASYVVADGNAKDIIEITPKSNPYIGQYISSILSNNEESGKYPNGNALSIINGLITSGNTIIPKVIKAKDQVKLDGCGVIKGFKLLGFINGDDTKNLLIARGELSTGVYSINSKNNNMVYEMNSIKTKKKIKFKKNNKVSIELNISSEGSLAEYYDKKESYKDGKKVNQIQKELNKSMKKSIQKSLKTILKKYPMDLLNVSNDLQKFHPSTWKKVQKKWDKEFKNIEIKVEVTTKIRRVGNIEI